MELRILGPLEVVAGDRVVPLPRRKHRALLAVLALHPGEVVSSDRLLEDLWGERPPRTAREALQNYVSQVRRQLGAEILATRPPGYVLTVAPEQVDLGHFELLRDQARATDDTAVRAEKLREALALWRGPPLADLAFEPFAQLELPHLNDLYLSAREDLIDAELALGHHADLLAEIDALVVEHPFDERLRCQLILALYRAGRQGDALDACRKARHALVEELGLEPSGELRAIEQAILRQEPELAAPRAARLDSRPARRTVTVLFAALVDSTGFLDELDPEPLRVLLDRYLGAMRAAVERHGGRIEELVGHAAMAVFGLPNAHEDDALRAVRTAVEIREALAALDGELGLRIGVNTGEVYAAGAERLVTGASVGVARRLEQATPAGEILLGAATLRLVRGAVAVEAVEPLRRGGEPGIAAFRLLGVTPGAPAFERHFEARLVGRAQELAELRSAFESVSAERRCRVATIVGDAGIGKTRLAAELVAGLGEAATILVGRCASYGEGATYLPLSEMVGQAALEALLVGAGSIGEEFLAVRNHFESLARERPLVLVFEDVHWAEPTLLDLIEYLRELLSDAQLLLLCLARPELLEARPEWHASLRLAPLEVDEAHTLLDALAGGIEPGLRARIVEIAEGNPLYVEQLLAYATEGGAIEAVPPTLEALLASRFDRLEPAERALLQHAALVGREFWLDAVRELLPPEHAAFVDRQLEELVRKGLVYGSPGEGFRFEHVLIRDVAYTGLPKAQRAELHERLADWLSGRAAGSDELIGYHLEQAHDYLVELGPRDGRADRLAREAGARLGSAGIRAWKRGDTPATVNLLGRASTLLAEHDPVRLELLCELAVALRGAGELGRAEETLVEARQAAAAAGDRRAELRARLELANVRLFRDPGGRAGELLEAAAAAIPVFEALEDDHSLSRAWRLTGYVEGAVQCHYSAAAEAAERALRHGRKSGWSTAASVGDLAAALYYGPTPVAAAIRRCRALLKEADLGGEASVLVHLGGLEAMRGRFAEARRLVDRSEGLYEDIGQAALAHVNCGTLRGQIESLAGDHVAAEGALRASYDALESIGDRAYLATRAAELAEAVYVNGRHHEAVEWSRVAEEVGGTDDIPTQFLWRSVRAKLLAAEGEVGQAQALAHEAAELAAGTDALNQRAKVMLDVAEVLRLCGLPADAVAPGEHALGLYELKGNTVGAERARRLLAELEPV